MAFTMNTPLTREQIETSIAVCDPHFHMWDVGERPNPNLGDPSEQLPTYQAADYFSDMSQLPSPLHLVSGVHVETVVGQQEGSETPDTVEETKWVCAQLKEAAPKRPFGWSLMSIWREPLLQVRRYYSSISRPQEADCAGYA